MSERGEVVWTPSGTPTAIDGFLAAVDQPSWAGLLDWSLRDGDGFWGAIARELGVAWVTPPDGGVALASGTMPGARWFPGATLNYATHALRRASIDPEGIAVVAVSQSRPHQQVSWAELRTQVAGVAAGLRTLGVGVGDCVAAYAPNCLETLVAFLASASLGATWASCAPEFGARAVIDRLGQIDPVVLFTVDGYRYGTKAIDRSAEGDEIEAALPTVRHRLGIRHLGTGPDDVAPLVTRSAASGSPLDPLAVPFDHPLYVLFSSGTTGLPKAIVHGHGGITVEHLKALRLQHDLGPGDRFLWFTTTGWMMWNYLVSGLLVGATVVLYDGDPGHPDLSTLWRTAADTGATLFGTSAPFLMSCRSAGLQPGRDLDLAALRSVGSTGSTLPPDGYRWIRDAVGPDVLPNSISGGTDVCTAFVGMVPVLPVRAGELGTRYLGCAVEAFGPDGRAVAPGATGELVVTAPMPSMPVGFAGDPDGSRYRRAYFDHYPNVWRHGDWITFDADGSCVISGRSDATLNRGGVRLGTADYYAVVEDLPEVADSLVVHLEQADEADDTAGLGRLVLFVELTPGHDLTDDLRTRIVRRLRTELSPRHVPDAIEAVPAVPRTLSGKKLEVPVKQILQGATVADVVSPDSLKDPSALDHFVARSHAARAGDGPSAG